MDDPVTTSGDRNLVPSHLRDFRRVIASFAPLLAAASVYNHHLRNRLRPLGRLRMSKVAGDASSGTDLSAALGSTTKESTGAAASSSVKCTLADSGGPHCDPSGPVKPILSPSISWTSVAAPANLPSDDKFIGSTQSDAIISSRFHGVTAFYTGLLGSGQGPYGCSFDNGGSFKWYTAKRDAASSVGILCKWDKLDKTMLTNAVISTAPGSTSVLGVLFFYALNSTDDVDVWSSVPIAGPTATAALSSSAANSGSRASASKTSGSGSNSDNSTSDISTTTDTKVPDSATATSGAGNSSDAMSFSTKVLLFSGLAMIVLVGVMIGCVCCRNRNKPPPPKIDSLDKLLASRGPPRKKRRKRKDDSSASSDESSRSRRRSRSYEKKESRSGRHKSDTSTSSESSNERELGAYDRRRTDSAGYFAA